MELTKWGSGIFQSTCKEAVTLVVDGEKRKRMDVHETEEIARRNRTKN